MAFQDNTPRSLTAWKLSADYPGNMGSGPADTKREFAGYDAPKMKFLFTVSFQWGELLSEMDPKLSEGSDSMAEIEYACKNATRPNVSVNYTEVNQYNYRFKVPTRTDVGTVTVVFYDDNKNTAHALLTEYLKAISPVANIPRESYNVAADIQQWASLGPLPDADASGLIRSMRVTHHYNAGYTLDPSMHSRVYYDYINPKIQQFNWDDLDMSVSDASMISVTFVYDSVTIVTESNADLSVDSSGNVTVNNGRNGDGDRLENVRG